jgi:hypothetical protein
MYKLFNKNNETVKHVIFLGDPKFNFRESKVVDLEFESEKKAKEIANLMDAIVKEVV